MNHIYFVIILNHVYLSVTRVVAFHWHFWRYFVAFEGMYDLELVVTQLF